MFRKPMLRTNKSFTGSNDSVQNLAREKKYMKRMMQNFEVRKNSQRELKTFEHVRDGSLLTQTFTLKL